MIVAIMHAMVARGHKVSLLTWDQAGAETFYPLNTEIAWHKLDMGNPAEKAGVKSIVARAPRIRALVKEAAPSVIVCFQGGPFRAMQLYTLGLGIPLVAAERTAPTLYDHANSATLRRIEHFSFRFAKKIAVQIERYRELYPRSLQKKIVAIPNPVSPVTRRAHPEKPLNGRFRLLSVGRLSYQKNYPVLISAFSKLVERFPEWDLHIVGEGTDREKLECQIAETETLKGRVFLPGATNRISEQYAKAHLFCLPARWEGFPNALAEAFSHGLPAVGFAGCAGVSDLIEPGKTGMLAEGNGDPVPLASALADLMEAPARRSEMGWAATEAMRDYHPETIFNRWEAFLCGCATR